MSNIVYKSYHQGKKQRLAERVTLSITEMEELFMSPHTTDFDLLA